MSILITGGAGFIGSNFVHYMLKNSDYKLINLDTLTYAGRLENLSDINSPNYFFVQGNICDAELVNYLIRTHKIETIINFAAETHVDRSIKTPKIFTITNVLGTQTLLDAAKNNGNIRFIQISTDEVYGALTPNAPKFTERTPLAPNSPYSASKAAADMLVAAYHHTYNLPINITRCSNNYGPRQFPEKLIPLMISNAKKNIKLPVYGDGLQVRDWLYVEDHCRAVHAVLERGKDGEVYNIGGNNEWENIEIVRLLLKKLGKSEDLIEFVEDRLGHDRRYAIDNTKITTELGWKPFCTFEEGIEKTLEYYSEF